MKNKPYVKKYDGNKLINPISKDKPYLHKFKTTAQQKSILKESLKVNIPIPNPNAKMYLLLKNRNKLPKNKKGINLTYKEWMKQKINNAIKNN